MGAQSSTEVSPLIYKIGSNLALKLNNIRDSEYRVASRFLKGCDNILDVGCGTGTFIGTDPKKIKGIDINPENVAYCNERGLNARVGDALSIPYEDNSFDGVLCSHVLQVFDAGQAVQLIRELARVTKPGGTVVITTLNWFPRFFRHIENARPYPPDALRGLFSKQKGATSPMWDGVPRMTQESIWVRRPPLVYFYSTLSHNLNRVSAVLNLIQYRLGLRKYWNYDSYTVKFRNLKGMS